jgi:hypothetical protein
VNNFIRELKQGFTAIESKLENTWMQTREIPRDEWRSFFDVFSRQHAGWLATLEILGHKVAAQPEPREFSLKGITLTVR